MKLHIKKLVWVFLVFMFIITALYFAMIVYSSTPKGFQYGHFCLYSLAITCLSVTLGECINAPEKRYLQKKKNDAIKLYNECLSIIVDIQIRPHQFTVDGIKKLRQISLQHVDLFQEKEFIRLMVLYDECETICKTAIPEIIKVQKWEFESYEKQIFIKLGDVMQIIGSLEYYFEQKLQDLDETYE